MHVVERDLRRGGEPNLCCDRAELSPANFSNSSRVSHTSVTRIPSCVAVTQWNRLPGAPRPRGARPIFASASSYWSSVAPLHSITTPTAIDLPLVVVDRRTLLRTRRSCPRDRRGLPAGFSGVLRSCQTRRLSNRRLALSSRRGPVAAAGLAPGIRSVGWPGLIGFTHGWRSWSRRSRWGSISVRAANGARAASAHATRRPRRPARRRSTPAGQHGVRIANQPEHIVARHAPG